MLPSDATVPPAIPESTVPNETQSLDIVVLGGGTGGYGAAFRAGQLGLKVALVDDNPRGLGGTCLHIGCIPTKAMLESADLLDRLKHAGEFGITVGAPGFDPGAIAARRDKIVARLVKGVTSLAKKNGVEYIVGRGRLEGPQQVRVRTTDAEGKPSGEVILKARDVILATGSRVKSLPGLEPDGEHIVTSDDVLRASAVPASIIVVGSGAVGVEFASYYHDLGCEVTVLEYLPRLVPLEDGDISKEMERVFKRRGIKVITSARFDPAAVKADESGVSVMVGRRRVKSRPSCAPSRCSWPPAAPPTSRTSGWRRLAPWSIAASCRSMARCARPIRTSTPSATWPAGCGWRTWPRTKASRRCTPSPERRSRRSTT